MNWLIFVAVTIVCWGLYGPVLHSGQIAMGGSPMRALLCVGMAYFLVGIIIPGSVLTLQGESGNFNARGISLAGLAGTLGVIGALGIIYTFQSGGKPFYVMPLVFAGAPIINVIGSVIQHPPKTMPSPWLLVGFVLAAMGAYLILRFKPI